MAVTLTSQLSQLVAEFAPEKFKSTINNASPILGSGALEKVKADGREFAVYATVGGNQATAWVADNGYLPAGNSYLPSRASVLPANVINTMRIGRSASYMKLSDSELASLFQAQLDLVADDMARHIARGIFGGTASPNATTSWSGTASGATATVTFTDVSIFKPGAAYDFDDGYSNSHVVRCTGVTAGAVGSNSANVAGTVTFTHDITNPATGSVPALTRVDIITTAVFKLRGDNDDSHTFGAASSGATSQRMVSLADIATTGSLHGLTLAGWVGHSLALSAAYTQEAVLAFGQRMFQYSGKYFSHALMAPQVAVVHAAAAGASVAPFGLTAAASGRISLDGSMDKFGSSIFDSGLRLGGRPIIVDPNCPATEMYLHNKDAVKLAVWKEAGPDEESGDPRLLARDKFSIDVQFSASLNLACNHRAAIGRVSSITSL